ncbi:MAG: hypothetical protein EDX89_04145 [Acidobacteria bacterium]|nr:MAG: hypothetical protein EDX89_04145 [Acidobacteriota bacterium]
MTPRRRRELLLVLLCVVLVLAAWWGMREPAASAPESPPAARRPGDGPPGRVVRAEEIPALDLVAGRGDIPGAVTRNPFRFHEVPTPTPPPPTPTPTPFPAQGSAEFIGPRLPTPVPTATPIVPPPIPYKLVGVFGPKERPILALEDGGRLIVAREGDLLDGRFILKKINRESADFEFLGLPPGISRRLPFSS